MPNAGDGDQEDQYCWMIEFYLIDQHKVKISWNGWRRWSGAVGIAGPPMKKKRKKRGQKEESEPERPTGRKEPWKLEVRGASDGQRSGQEYYVRTPFQETGLDRLRYAKCI